MMLNGLIDAFQRLAAKFRILVRGAVKLRNQCNRVIAYSLCESPVPALNGERWLLRQLSGRVAVLFDIGANEGDWTACAIEALGPVNRVVLFEPSTSVCARLKVRFSESSNIKVVHAAVGQFLGSLVFYESLRSTEGSSLWRSAMAASGETYSVPVTTVSTELDSLGESRLDFLKIDTEGNDFLVLLGAEALLRKQAIGAIQFEYGATWIASGSTLHRAVDYLGMFGYHVFALRPSGLERFTPSVFGEYFGYTNFVALSPEFAPFFQKSFDRA